RTLITLLHLREIEARHHYDFSITSEMVDLRNRALAQVTHADDFIVSDRIASLLLSQLAQDAALKAVFDDLFNPEGAEIYLRPASDYVRPDRVVSFATLIESARRRGETPLGYRVAVAADDASRNFGVVLNPDRSAEFRLDAADRVIVLASEG
ncbi:MAG: potassium transporter TrkA, partial [Chloroflexota bacterium]